MTTITRRLEFDYAHRVIGHEGKCRHLHGHRGVAEVTVQAPGLDEVGRVIDFGAVKQLVGSWVDEHWDHNALLRHDDPLLADPVQAVRLCGRQPYVMSGNPTAENIAQELFRIASALLPAQLKVVRVRIWETPNCCADYTPESR